MRTSIAPRLEERELASLPPMADRRGVTMLEYGLVAGLIALVCVTAINRIAPEISSVFNNVESSL